MYTLCTQKKGQISYSNTLYTQSCGAESIYVNTDWRVSYTHADNDTL